MVSAGQRLSCCCRRKGFGHVLQVNQQLISILEDSAGAEIDLDNAALRVTLDVIGRVGFGKDFGATRDLNSGKANLAFDMMEAGAHLPTCYELPRSVRIVTLHIVDKM